MKKKIGILLIVIMLGLTYCTPPKYIPKKESEVLLLDLDNSITNYIPILDEDIKKSEILETTYNLIKQQEYSKLEKYLTLKEETEINTSDIYLSKTLLQITKKNYSEAIISIKKIKDSDYILLKRLISIDLKYELMKGKGIKSYDQLLKDYQELIDAYPDDIPLKKIVMIRMRYIRYDY